MKTEQENNSYSKTVDKLDGKFDDVKQKANSYVNKGMAGAESAIDSLNDMSARITHRVEDAVSKGIKQVKATSHDAEELVKKYPLYTVAGAAAISFVVGLVYGKISSKR